MTSESHAADGKFQGTSKNHDFHEALDAALAAAKNGLRTDLIHWKLVEMSGEDGGARRCSRLDTDHPCRHGAKAKTLKFASSDPSSRRPRNFPR